MMFRASNQELYYNVWPYEINATNGMEASDHTILYPLLNLCRISLLI